MVHLDFKDLQSFSEYLQEMSRRIGFKVSSRGWAYLLEQERVINKDQFDKVTNTINKARKKGYLPIDFTAEESAREFEGVEEPTKQDIVDYFGNWIHYALESYDMYKPNWWDGEDYYIQMVVEKIDLVTLFSPVCKHYKIPIANSKGWSSMLQRAEYARRFKEAQKDGKKCVLLYCGDHDPDGLRISEFLRKNLYDLKDVEWIDGKEGYDPEDLIIDRFGLNYDFIQENGFTWIDNLTTGSGRNLASPSHKNFNMPYVQEYLKTIGERKCEANAIITLPQVAKEMATNAIEKYLGENSRSRFVDKRAKAERDLDKFLDESGSRDLLNEVLTKIENRDDE